jgi:hypothetical protein
LWPCANVATLGVLPVTTPSAQWWRVRQGGIMPDDEQERRIDLAVAALRVLAVYDEEELEEARQRMRRIADDETGEYKRITDQRVQGSSGP